MLGKVADGVLAHAADALDGQDLALVTDELTVLADGFADVVDALLDRKDPILLDADVVKRHLEEVVRVLPRVDRLMEEVVVAVSLEFVTVSPEGSIEDVVLVHGIYPLLESMWMYSMQEAIAS